MIKTYCDCCGNEIDHRNEIGLDDSTGNRCLKAEIRSPQPVDGKRCRLTVELMEYKDGVSNDGHFCKYCVLDAFANLDDGKRPNQPKITAKAIAMSAVKLVEKTSHDGEANSSAHRDILLYGIIIRAFEVMRGKSVAHFSDALSEPWDQESSDQKVLTLLQRARNSVDNQEQDVDGLGLQDAEARA